YCIIDLHKNDNKQEFFFFGQAAFSVYSPPLGQLPVFHRHFRPIRLVKASLETCNANQAGRQPNPTLSPAAAAPAATVVTLPLDFISPSSFPPLLFHHQ